MALSDFFSKFLNDKEESVLGVDIGSSSIKVVQIKKKRGRAVLETYGELELGPYAGFVSGQATSLPPEKVVEALKDLMKVANVTTKNCGITIPIRSSLISVIDMPQVSDKQLNQMIPIEARKYIPVPITEVALDWFIIPASSNINDDSSLDLPENTRNPIKEKKVKVLVVAIHNDVLTKYAGFVSGAELDAGFFEIEMFSNIRGSLEEDTNPVLICDMGASNTKLYIVERGIVRNSHIIGRGSQDITMGVSTALSVPIDVAEKLKHTYGNNEPERDKQIGLIVDLVLDPIFSEVATVILNYERKESKNISKVILTGGGAMLNGIIEKAKSRLSAEVVMADPFSKVETPAFLGEVLKKSGVAFSVAVGAALRRLQELS